MNIYQVAEANRDALLKRDEEALRALVGYYQSARATAEAELRAFQLKIAQAKERGETVGPSWLFQERRLSGLLERIGKELDGWGGDAARLLALSQRSAIQSARSDAAGLLRAALGPARPAGRALGVEVGFDRLPSDAFLDMVGFVSDGSPLVESFLGRLGDAKRGALKEIRQALTTGVALGKSPAVTARRIRSAMGGPLYVAMRYTRTETMRAYRTATLREYRGNADLVEMWEWSASLSRRTCPVCLALHGEKFPLSEPFGSHPNCRCSALPVLKPLSAIVPGAEDAPELPTQSGEEYLRRLPERDQVAILGKEKARRWRDGELPLRNLVGYHDSKKWGPGRSERSLKEALTGEAPGAFHKAGNIAIPKPAPAPPADPVAAVLARLESARQEVAAGREPLVAAHRALEREGMEYFRLWARAKAKHEFDYGPTKAEDMPEEVKRLRAVAAEFNKKEEAARQRVIKYTTESASKYRAALYLPVGDAVGTLMLETKTVGKTRADAREGAAFVGRLVSKALELRANIVPVFSLPKNGRAYCVTATGAVHIAPTSGADVAVHEMGHWLEFQSAKARLAVRDFYARRTAGEPLTRMKDLFPGHGYGAGEITRPDKFASPYTGKWYGSFDGKTIQSATEIASMGLEALYRDPLGFSKEDPDFFAFMVRLLAGDEDAGKKTYTPEGGANP